MNNEKNSDGSVVLRTVVAVVLIALAAVLRIVPHPWNFAPIGAMALFSGATLRDRRLAYLLPLLALFVGDLFVGLYKMMPVIYASYMVNVWIGTWLEKRKSAPRIGGAVFLGALQFFVVTNFAVWAGGIGLYPHTGSGLAACYVAGVPYFWNTLAGDAIFAAVLFGSFALAERFVPAMREERVAVG